MELSAEFYQDLAKLLHDHPMSKSEAPSPELIAAYIAFARQWPLQVSASLAAFTYSLAGVHPHAPLVVGNPWRPRLINKLWRKGCAQFDDLTGLAQTLAAAIQQDTNPTLAEGASIAAVMFSEEDGPDMLQAEAKSMTELVAWKAYRHVNG